MLQILLARLHQRHQTMTYPDGPAPTLPDRFRGAPRIDRAKCPPGCVACEEACPTHAIRLGDAPAVDLGRCLFCTDCVDACPQGAISHSTDHRLATRSRTDLAAVNGSVETLATALTGKMQRMFGRSLKLRQVSAAGCNACEADTNVLNTVGWDLGRFGIQFVASPRHADGILVTGPVSQNMRLGLEKTYAAIAKPKLVIAVGACAISGGPFVDHAQVHNGISDWLPVDLFIPGCPPHPLTILDGLLRLLGRIEDQPQRLPSPTLAATSASAV